MPEVVAKESTATRGRKRAGANVIELDNNQINMSATEPDAKSAGITVASSAGDDVSPPAAKKPAVVKMELRPHPCVVCGVCKDNTEALGEHIDKHHSNTTVAQDKQEEVWLESLIMMNVMF
jgi:hypothetical protein